MILSILKEKKRPKSRRRQLIAQLDKLTSLAVRKRDGHTCRMCGKQDRVYHHHLMTKRRMATRFDLRNGVALCFSCHQKAHAAPEEFRRWVVSWMGEKGYEALYIRSQMRASYKECDLNFLLLELGGAA